MKTVSTAQTAAREWTAALLRRNGSGLLLAAAAVLLLQSVLGSHGLRGMWSSQREISRVRADIRRLNDENQRLEQRVKALQTDAAVECIARATMGLERPGETTVNLPAPPGTQPDEQPVESCTDSAPLPPSPHQPAQ